MTMEEDFNVDATTLNPVKEFTYLGSILANDDHFEAELQKIMSKASMSFGCLRERLWNNHNVSIRVKGKIYRAIKLSTLLYGAETLTLYRRHVKEATRFHDETSAVNHEDQMAGQSDKHTSSQAGRTPSYGRISAGQDIF